MSARPRSARTLRDYYVRCGAGIRATLGALPLIPHQGTSRCSIVALRPIGLIACFAPRLRVAVPAIGRAPLWRSGPSTFTQNHAAVSARPRSARTLRVSLCGLWPRGTGTLGGRCPPKTPCQEPEVPGPPTFTQLPRQSLTPPTTSANAQPIGIAAQIPTSPTTPANA